MSAWDTWAELVDEFIDWIRSSIDDILSFLR